MLKAVSVGETVALGLLKAVGVGDAEATGVEVVSGVCEGVIGADPVAPGVGFSGAITSIVLSICLAGMTRSR